MSSEENSKKKKKEKEKEKVSTTKIMINLAPTVGGGDGYAYDGEDGQAGDAIVSMAPDEPAEGMHTITVDPGLNDADSQAQLARQKYLDNLELAVAVAAQSYARGGVDDRLCPDDCKGERRAHVLSLAGKFLGDYTQYCHQTYQPQAESAYEKPLIAFSNKIASVIDGIKTFFGRTAEAEAQDEARQLEFQIREWIYQSDYFRQLVGPNIQQRARSRDFVKQIHDIHLVEASSPILFGVQPKDTSARPTSAHPRLRAYCDPKRYGILLPKVIWREIESIFYYESSRRLGLTCELRFGDPEIEALQQSSLVFETLATDNDEFDFILKKHDPTHHGTSSMPPAPSDDLELGDPTTSGGVDAPANFNGAIPEIDAIHAAFSTQTMNGGLRTDIIHRATHFFRNFYAQNAGRPLGEINLGDYVMLTMKHLPPAKSLDQLLKTQCHESGSTLPPMPRNCFTIYNNGAFMHRMSSIMYHALAVYCVLDLTCHRITRADEWEQYVGMINGNNQCESDIALMGSTQSCEALQKDDAAAYSALLNMPSEYWVRTQESGIPNDVDCQFWLNVSYDESSKQMRFTEGSSRQKLSEQTAWMVLDGPWYSVARLTDKNIQ